MAGQGSEGTVIRALVGNATIAVMKIAAWLVSGSGAMLSEAIHTLADVGNQALLLLGIRHARRVPDELHPWGYGQAAFFWALVSALGIFFLGAGVTIYHGVETLLHPPPALEIGWLTWTTLALAFVIDGAVLLGAVRELIAGRPDHVAWRDYIARLKDPMLLAVLLEDFAACIGVLIAAVGIVATWRTGDPMFDGLASIAIGVLLGFVAVFLVRLNQRFLIGQAVDPEIASGIHELLMGRASIESVHRVQSRWIGPSTFAYKAEVDFDGSWFAAQLEPTFKDDFAEATDRDTVAILLRGYTEEVARMIAREVDAIESAIRIKWPEAAFIMLESNG